MISDKSLQRFTDAQKNIYPQVVQELANGLFFRKLID